jgi:hypothetical protein
MKGKMLSSYNATNAFIHHVNWTLGFAALHTYVSQQPLGATVILISQNPTMLEIYIFKAAR